MRTSHLGTTHEGLIDRTSETICETYQGPRRPGPGWARQESHKDPGVAGNCDVMAQDKVKESSLFLERKATFRSVGPGILRWTVYCASSSMIVVKLYFNN